MAPEEVEQMLYEHAIKTKIRAPLPERLSNLGYNRIVTSGIVAGAALVCSLVMPKSGAQAGNMAFGGLARPAAAGADSSKRPLYTVPQGTGHAVDGNLAMSPVGS